MPQAFAPWPGATAAARELLADETLLLRLFGSMLFGILIYTTAAFAISKRFPRQVPRDVFAPKWSSDFVLAIISLAFGSPVLATCSLAHDKWGIMRTYMDVSDYGWGWWALSIPVYLFLFDATFYVLHLVLHTEPIYALSHANHHAFRPPTAWSGIAIDPFENILSGMAPYLVPLFILPFHMPTVYAINICLVGWASLLHSSCAWDGGWLMMGPAMHNLHHERGRMGNGNYGAIFKLIDRACGTLKEDAAPYWMVAEAAERQSLRIKAAATEQSLHSHTERALTPTTDASSASESVSSRTPVLEDPLPRRRSARHLA